MYKPGNSNSITRMVALKGIGTAVYTSTDRSKTVVILHLTIAYDVDKRIIITKKMLRLSSLNKARPKNQTVPTKTTKLQNITPITE